MDTFYKYSEQGNIGVFEFLHEKINYDNAGDSIDHIKEIISKKNIPDFILDFRRGTSIDSVGLGILISIKNAAVKKGSRMHLVCDNEIVLRVLSITRMESFYKIFKEFDEAVAWITNERK